MCARKKMECGETMKCGRHTLSLSRGLGTEIVAKE